MKKALSWILVLALCAGMLIVPATAENAGEWTYTVADGEASITGYNGDGVEVEVPSALDGYPVTSIQSDAFSDNTALTKIMIPGSVTSIGDGVFYNCTNLTEITIPDSITSIGYMALESSKLYSDEANWEQDALYIGNALIAVKAGVSGSFSIKDGTTVVADGAFYDCEGITEVAVPASAAYLDGITFYELAGLKRFIVSDESPYFSNGSDGVLFNKDQTRLVRCPRGKIGEYSIPDSVTTLDGCALIGCDKLTGISIPGSLTEIQSRAAEIADVTFLGCYSLTAFTVAAGNEAFRDVDGVLMNKAGSELICYPAAKTGEYTVPSGVTAIRGYAFSEADDLTGVTIPEGVKHIGAYAFELCRALRSVSLPKGLESIGDKAFSSCYLLENVTIPGSVAEIGAEAFAGCEALTEAVIMDGVTSIGDAAFAGCINLSSIAIPASVTSFGRFAFAGFDIQDVYYGGREWEWSAIEGLNESGLFYEILHFNSSGPASPDSYITEGAWRYVVFDDTATVVGYIGAFATPTVPETLGEKTVTAIGKDAFKANTLVTNVTIPNSVTSIGESAFNGCKALESVSIPDTVTSIGDYAFYDCWSLGSIDLPGGLTAIGDYTFEYCKSLECVDIPSGITTIGDVAFAGCEKLETVAIPAGVTSIGEEAFHGCFALTTAELPNTLTELGMGAFQGCTDLPSIEIPERITRIEDATFLGCESLASVTIPISVSSIGEAAFDGCTKLAYVDYKGSQAQWNGVTVGDGNGPLQSAEKRFALNPGGGGGGGVQIPKLSTPTELSWNERIPWLGYTLPGTLSCQISQPVQDRIEYKVYRVGTEFDECVWDFVDFVNEGLHVEDCFIMQGMNYTDELTGEFIRAGAHISGTYYFTAQLLGDGTNYLDGAVARSENWVYTAPENRLSVPTGLAWTDDGKASWEYEDKENVYGYAVDWYKQDSSDPSGWHLAGGSFIRDYTDTFSTIAESIVQRCGEGMYAFRVRAISSDITAVSLSEWSQLSGTRYLGGSDPSQGGGGDNPQPGDGQDLSLPQLAAPSELTWGVAWTEILQKNEETGQFDIVDNQSSNLPGSASFKNNQPTQNTFRIQFYSVGSDGDTKIYSIQHNRGNTPADYLSFTHFLDGWGFPELPDSGVYYFTVQSLGDGTQYRDSEVVTSPIWSYTAPSTQLPAPDGLAWTANGELSWNRPAGDGILGYAKKYYYRDESNGGAWKEVLWNGYSTHPSPDVTTWKMGDYVLQQNGAGYYAFRVQAVSSDITTIRSSEWSELSPARWFGDGSTTGPTLNEALETVNNVNVNSSDEEKQAAITAAESALNAVGSETLKENLLADQDGTGATQQLIEKTEELMDTKATPTVAAGLDEATTAQLNTVAAETDVVGAGLNAEAGEKVQLLLDKPDPAANHVIPEQFANTVQIKMDLYKGEENITADHHELAVPVKIRMPVPEGINPDFLVILHHRADGTVREIIHPYLTWEGNKAYANFVLTSFSDFTFAEEQLAAVRTGAGVNVSAKLPDGAETKTVVCAAYDANGKMLAAASTATFTDGKANVSLLCAPDAVSCVRAFFLNAQQAPVTEARSIVPESA